MKVIGIIVYGLALMNAKLNQPIKFNVIWINSY